MIWAELNLSLLLVWTKENVNVILFFKPVYQMTEGNGYFYLGNLQPVGRFQEIGLLAVSIYKNAQLVPIHINADVDIGYLK